MHREVKLFEEPLVIKRLLSEDTTEMTELQSAMLCGLIKENQPKKILEVGVAAGGTTAIILNCISMLEMDTEVYSVDVSEQYYRDSTKKTGYLAEECKKILNKKVKHKFYKGYLPEYLDEIGKGIDFLILDTTHALPGELLDFLAALPYLKEGAIVVLHDIFLNQHAQSANAFSTRVLLSSIVGEKIVGKGNDNPYDYIELGACKITQDTTRYIDNVFSALMITWEYVPDFTTVELYRKLFSRYYSDDLMEELNMAVEMNRNTVSEKRKMNKQSIRSVHELLGKLTDRENIFIYGCGSIGIKLFALLEGFGIKVDGYVISDGRKKPCIDQRVEYISEIDSDKATIVLGMADWNQREVCKDPRLAQWIFIDKSILHFLHIIYS